MLPRKPVMTTVNLVEFLGIRITKKRKKNKHFVMKSINSRRGIQEKKSSKIYIPERFTTCCSRPPVFFFFSYFVPRVVLTRTTLRRRRRRRWVGTAAPAVTACNARKYTHFTRAFLPWRTRARTHCRRLHIFAYDGRQCRCINPPDDLLRSIVMCITCTMRVLYAI